MRNVVLKPWKGTKAAVGRLWEQPMTKVVVIATLASVIFNLVTLATSLWGP